MKKTIAVFALTAILLQSCGESRREAASEADWDETYDASEADWDETADASEADWDETADASEADWAEPADAREADSDGDGDGDGDGSALVDPIDPSDELRAEKLDNALLVQKLVQKLSTAIAKYNRLTELWYQKPETVVYRFDLSSPSGPTHAATLARGHC